MQFDWTTFALEILNFLVLLWILKRFLYQPVLGMLDARQQAMRDQAAQADAVHKEAEAMKTQYEQRLNDWKLERDKAWQALEQEMTQEKTRQLDALKKQMAEEREKGMAREEASAASHEAALARRATAAAYRTAALMLQRLSTDRLTARIAELFEEDLRSLPPAQRDALRDAAARLGPDDKFEIASAHPLDESIRQRIVKTLEEIAGHSLQPHFTESPALMSGVRVSVGQSLLQANLADELSFFSDHDSKL